MSIDAVMQVTTTQEHPAQKNISAGVFTRRNLILAALLFLMVLVSLIALEVRFKISPTGVSNAPHFIYQAESFLQGRWDLDHVTARTTDIITLHGKYYIVYPPFPALALLPFVAIWGLHTSDILFTTLLAALNFPLLYLLFEQARASGLTRRSHLANAIFSVVFFYGTLNLWLSLGGHMWFTAHILCLTCTLLSLLLALRRHYGWSAVLLACAFFCRATALLGFPLLFYLAWQDVNREQLVERFFVALRARRLDWQAIPWRRLLPPLAVAVVMVLLFMARNLAVFGSPLESGYSILIQQRYTEVTQGPFNLAYVPSNIVANFFSFPVVTFTSAFDRHPVIDVMNGGYAVSVFVTTPLFLLLFWRNRQWSLLRAVLWLTLGLVVVMVLLFHAAGWYQFGARYLFDGYPYAFLLLALNEVRVDWRFALLGLFGIIINLLGALEFWTHHIMRI
ncbi:MAG: hypothetical protein ACXVDA_24305 [Ktedonobacterales bacterium]